MDPLPTAAILDACLRLDRRARLGPPALQSLLPGRIVLGAALPARHAGSVDVFLEALEEARPGMVLVVDNAGRDDEGCVGDLTALEVQAAGLSGMVVWGRHRDTAELHRIGLPVWSRGACPAGPSGARRRAPDALQRARLGQHWIHKGDLVACDDDGLVALDPKDAPAVLSEAATIARRERAQADRVRGGENLRKQFRFREFLARRRKDPGLTFREHLRRIGGEIEQ